MIYFLLCAIYHLIKNKIVLTLTWSYVLTITLFPKSNWITPSPSVGEGGVRGTRFEQPLGSSPRLSDIPSMIKEGKKITDSSLG